MASKAGIVGRVQMRRGLLNATKQFGASVNKDAVETALVAGIIAKNAGQNTIATTPSDLSIEPKDNRIWTGAMYEAFDAEVNQRGNKITVRFGWLRKKKKYFMVQEEGGQVETRRGTITVSGMHAMTNAAMAAERYLESKGIK
jgi:hypothetical protein